MAMVSFGLREVRQPPAVSVVRPETVMAVAMAEPAEAAEEPASAGPADLAAAEEPDIMDLAAVPVLPGDQVKAAVRLIRAVE